MRLSSAMGMVRKLRIIVLRDAARSWVLLGFVMGGYRPKFVVEHAKSGGVWFD